MAPEVLLGRPLTSACDVFALGMVWPTPPAPGRLAWGCPRRFPTGSSTKNRTSAAWTPRSATWWPRAWPRSLPNGPPRPGSWKSWPDPGPHPAAGKPTAAAATDLARAARLLAEAEQIARVLPLDEQALAPQDRAAAIPGPPPPPASSSARARGLDDEYDRALPLAVQRARALVHVAAVAARSDPAHAAQLLDDALHPRWPAPQAPSHGERFAGTAGYQHILEALVWHSASEFGMLLARIDPSPAKRLVADLEKIPPVIRGAAAPRIPGRRSHRSSLRWPR